jgi:Arc/MetJ family transcription regulator
MQIYAWSRPMRTTLDIEDQLLKQAKVVAARQGSTLTAVIEQALRRMLEGGGTASRKKSVKLPLLPIAPGGKGQLVDLSSNERLSELLDEDS